MHLIPVIDSSIQGMQIRTPTVRNAGVDDNNLHGWESVARNWANVTWPRRPRLQGEFEKALPLISAARLREGLVLGATPEFRAMLRSRGMNVTLYEKSAASLGAMDRILQDQFGLPPNERVIPEDWESQTYERGRYTIIMGDLVSGYMETPERFLAFLAKVREMLLPGGTLLLREFVNEPFDGDPTGIASVDHRRWAYILHPGFAIEGDGRNATFLEEKLAYNLSRTGDYEALATCANPPRSRLMLSFSEYEGMFEAAGLEPELLVKPEYGLGPVPALWALGKR